MAKIFTGDGRFFQELQAVQLDPENLGDIAQRIKLQPQFLGEQLLVIGETANFSMAPAPNRRELLALDALGRTVAVVLTTGTADVGSGIDTRALELAAWAAARGAEELGKITLEFISQPVNDSLRRVWTDKNVEITEETVELTNLLGAMFNRDDSDFADQVNRQQRVILAAEGYTTRLVDEINWLNRAGVNIVGLRYKKYLVGGQEIFFAEQVVPRDDPAVDALENRAAPEQIEPWKVKGRQFYTERLMPGVAEILEKILIETRDDTFSVQWAHRHYFWLRGIRRTFRVRVYSRERLELGFYNTSAEAVGEFLARFKLPGVEVYTIGGYAESPFIAITNDMNLSPEWVRMMKAWLAGKD
ncbi:MAG: hypothetical protein J6333_03600 [Planctomycetes bacterium]|nr:hypothetical protein [Planctomycetota bacterium]